MRREQEREGSSAGHKGWQRKAGSRGGRRGRERIGAKEVEQLTDQTDSPARVPEIPPPRPIRTLSNTAKGGAVVVSPTRPPLKQLRFEGDEEGAATRGEGRTLSDSRAKGGGQREPAGAGSPRLQGQWVRANHCY